MISRRAALLIFGLPILFVATILVVQSADGTLSGAPTLKADCISHKGYGAWVGSSGVTLDAFCQDYQTVEAVAQDRRAHPENY
jgi:hypothetical protein